MLSQKMKKFAASLINKLQNLCSCLHCKFSCICKSTWSLITYFYQYILFNIDPFCFQIFYFLSVTSLGFLLLRVTKPRTNALRPNSLDLFFASVSAATTSSLSTIELEVLSDNQLVILIFLMLAGGKVFNSLVGLHFSHSKLQKSQKDQTKVDSGSATLSESSNPTDFCDQIELSIVTIIPNSQGVDDKTNNQVNSVLVTNFQKPKPKNLEPDSCILKYNSIQLLIFVVLGYVIVNHLVTFSLVASYLALVPSASNVLNQKGLQKFTFVVFTAISTFSGCGFLPTNENMIAFRKNSGLLLILIPQVLLGNTFFPACLRFSVWCVGKFFKKTEAKYLLQNSREVGRIYFHWLPSRHASLVAVTAFGFVLVQFVMFCSLEWNSASLIGLNAYEKVVGVLFQAVNTRHTGENIADLSIIAPSIWILFVVMMYLPAYTSFMGTKEGENFLEEVEPSGKRRWGSFIENFIMSQFSYIVVFIILVCITERRMIKEDPINFSVFNLIIEVISAYGNVGYSMGYKCEYQLRPEQNGEICVNRWYSLSGKWSREGKMILIVVMLFGRLKKFNVNHGRQWKLM